MRPTAHCRIQPPCGNGCGNMKVLNLYCGLGGNALHWPEYCDVTAVDVEPKVLEVYAAHRPNDKIVEADAHKYLLDNISEGWDFIWSSPPCQSHSRMQKATRHDCLKYPDMSLYQQVLLLTHHFDGKWVVENVRPYYEPLIKAQSVGRHLFWSNFIIRAKEIPQPKDFIFLGTSADTQKLKDWLGIQYDGNIYMGGNHCPGQALRNAVHPSLGLAVFQSAMIDEQKDLFA